MNRIDVVRAALAATRGERYLEIGVRHGDCFHAVDAPAKVAVDPDLRVRVPLVARLRRLARARDGTLCFRLTSDAFFARHAPRLAPFDVVFVDGLHTYEQSHRDVVNALATLAPDGVVVVHDCDPASAAAAAPTLAQAAATPGFDGDWNGDVYRTIVRLRTRLDLRVGVLDCDQGVGIVRRGEPDEVLELDPEAVARLTWDELRADRARLLGLRPPSDLAALLGQPRA